MMWQRISLTARRRYKNGAICTQTKARDMPLLCEVSSGGVKVFQGGEWVWIEPEEIDRLHLVMQLLQEQERRARDANHVT